MIVSPGTVVRSPNWRDRRQALSRWLSSHEAAIAAGRAVVWVGNGPMQARVNRELLAHHPVLLPPPARTTAALAHELALRAGHLLEVPGDEETLAYLAAALAGAEGPLRRYAPFATRPNTCRALAATLDRLRREQPDPATWVDQWGEAVRHRRADLEALAELERRLTERLARHGKVLPPTVHRAASEALSAGWAEIDALLVYDLPPLGASELALFDAVLAAAPEDRTVILPGDDGRLELFAPYQPLLQRLGETVSAPPDESLAMRLYRPGAARREEPVELLRVPGPQRAVPVVLREVVAAVEAGTAPDRIVIVAPNLAGQATMIRAEAARVGLPVRILAPRWTGTGERVERALRLLQLLADGFPRRATIELLREAPAREGLTDRQVAALDLVSRAAGIVGGGWREWRAEIQQLAHLHRFAPERVERVAAEELELALQAAERLGRRFGEAGPAHPAVWRRRLREWLAWLEGPTVEFGESGAEAPEERDPLRPLGALDVWPESGSLAAEAYLTLAAGLLAGSGPSDDPLPGTVLITDRIARGAGETDLVYLLDAVAGSLPPPRRELVPLDGHDLAAMGVRGGGSEAAWAAAAAEFLDTVTAGARLVLVEPASDDSGEPTLPSPLVQELREVIKPPAEQRVEAHERIPDSPRTWDEAMLAATDRDAPSLPAGADERLASLVRRAEIELSREAGEPTRFDGWLAETAAAEDLAAERFGPERHFSPAMLEQFELWPFRWFAERVLGLGEEREPVGHLDALTEGTLVHELLRLAYERCRAEADREGALRALVEERYGADRRQPGLSEAMWRHAVGRMRLWCERVFRAGDEEMDRVPRYLEQSFGAHGWPPLVLDDGPRRVVLHGRIDRIDQTDEGWILIDYKRSKPGKLHPDWQLPLYARKLREELSGPIAGFSYLLYRQGELAAAVSGEAAAERIDEATGELLAAVARIRAGDFRPWPAPEPKDWEPWDLRAAARVLARVGTEGDDE